MDRLNLWQVFGQTRKINFTENPVLGYWISLDHLGWHDPT